MASPDIKMSFSCRMVLITVTKWRKLQRRNTRMATVGSQKTTFLFCSKRFEATTFNNFPVCPIDIMSFVALTSKFWWLCWWLTILQLNLFWFNCIWSKGCIFWSGKLSLQRMQRRRPLLRRLMHSLWSVRQRRMRWEYSVITCFSYVLTNLVNS